MGNITVVLSSGQYVKWEATFGVQRYEFAALCLSVSQWLVCLSVPFNEYALWCQGFMNG